MSADRHKLISVGRQSCIAVLWIVSIGFAFRQINSGSVSAQGTNLSVMKADFNVTRLVKGRDATPIDVETGAYFIASDGRYRIDSLLLGTGERSAEIVNFRENRRVVLDFALKQATVGSNSTVWGGPSSIRRPAPGGPPTGLNSESNMTRLGTRNVAGLTLEGTLQTTTFYGNDRLLVHTMELWTYRFPDPRILPIVMERRFEGPDEIVERRVHDVATIQMSSSIFEVPTDFTVTQLPR